MRKSSADDDSCLLFVDIVSIRYIYNTCIYRETISS